MYLYAYQKGLYIFIVVCSSVLGPETEPSPGRKLPGDIWRHSTISLFSIWNKTIGPVAPPQKNTHITFVYNTWTLIQAQMEYPNITNFKLNPKKGKRAGTGTDNKNSPKLFSVALRWRRILYTEYELETQNRHANFTLKNIKIHLQNTQITKAFLVWRNV